jgi:RNA polymerase sigma factor (sigma-70 family)
MNTTVEAGIPVGSSDAKLVENSLRGDRDAFSQIVARYQSLVCSLAYSSTGSLAQSEDLAQETFAAAWKQLSGLREPEKLRSWLCGMVRNLSHRARRVQNREPAHAAEPIETLDKLPAPEPHPLEQAISREEEGILWRSLERIPESYREPLILFYRKHESIEQVALALELSEEGVRQRLTRGRKLLQKEVLAFVEGALERTSPGPAFTQGVMAMLPVMASSAKATALSATYATTVAATKNAASFGLVGSWFAILGSGFVSARAVADNAKSQRERKFIFSLVGLQFGLICLYLVVLVVLLKFVFPHPPFGRDGQLAATYLRPNIWFAMVTFLFCLQIVGLNLYRSRRQLQIQVQEKTFDEKEWKLPGRETSFTEGLSGSKLDSGLRFAKLSAFVLVVVAVTLFQMPWKLRFGQGMVISAITALILLLIWRLAASGMKNSPRFIGWSGPQFASLVGLSMLMGSATLFSFNFDQRVAQAHPGVLRAASPAEVSAFNFVVVLGYALTIGVILWIHRRYGSKFNGPLISNTDSMQ